MTPAELKAERKALKLTQKELAAKLGRNRVTIIRWEAGTMAIEAPETLELALETLRRRQSEAGVPA